VNRILPDKVRDSFFASWRDTQERWVQSIEEFFAPVPVWRVPLFEDEVLGVERLRRLGKALCGDTDPSKRFYNESPYRFRKVDGKYELHLKLPFVSSDDINLHKKLDELIIRVGGVKRHVSLPQRIAHCEPLSARVQEGELVVVLGRNNAERETKPQNTQPA